MGNSTLPTISDKLNVMASRHNRKLLAVLAKELKAMDSQIQELKENITSLKDKLNDRLTKTKCKEDKDKQTEPS